MNSVRDDIAILLGLRWRLLRRAGIRSGPARNRGGSLIVGGLIGGALILQLAGLIIGSLTVALSRGLEDPRGRAALAPVLAGLSSSVSLVLFLVALPAILSLLTYSSDLKLLLLAPLRPWTALGEKLATVYGALAGPTLILGLPILTGIGHAAGVAAPYYAAAALALLVLPIIPVSLAMLLTVSVLRRVPPARARAVTAVLGALLSAGFYVGTQLLASPRTYERAAGPPSLLTGAARGPWGLLPVSWPGRALGLLIVGDAGGALAYLVAAVAPSVLLAALAVALPARLFATGWATYQEVGRRSRRGRVPAVGVGAPAVSAIARTDAARERAAPAPAVGAGVRRPARRPAWWPLMGKEWRTLRRDPQLWARLLYSLVVVGFLFWQNLSRVSIDSAGAGGLPVSLGTVGFFGLLAFIVWLPLATLALPAVNREGRSLYLLALAPLGARDILLAKWAFAALPSLALSEALLLAGAVWLRLGAGEVAFGACALACTAVAVAGALLLVSLIWPRLDWDNPRRQVSAAASLVGGIGGLVLTGACGGLLVLTLLLGPRHPLPALAAGAGLFLLTGLVSLLVLLLAPARLQALLTAER